jgi:hypothetical protein
VAIRATVSFDDAGRAADHTRAEPVWIATPASGIDGPAAAATTAMPGRIPVARRSPVPPTRTAPGRPPTSSIAITSRSPDGGRST